MFLLFRFLFEGIASCPLSLSGNGEQDALNNFIPASFTRVNFDYSARLKQPLQIDDDALITAGLAPAAPTAACSAKSASATCAATLAALNRNPVAFFRPS